MAYRQYPQYNQWTLVNNATHMPHQNQQLQGSDKGVTLSEIEVLADVDSSIPEYKKKSFRQQWFSGLGLTLRAYAFVTFLVLATNLSIFIWAQKRFGIFSGYGTILQGDCASAKRLNLWLHLCINAFSTLVFLGSNAFVQAYSGPTREEVDVAHRRHRWLHIGVLSFRNMRGIAKRKALICLLLALTSIPFHLLYNSLVFSSLSANKYRVAAVTEDFVSGAYWNITAPSSRWINKAEDDTWAEIQRSAPAYERLSNSDCIKTYSEPFQSTNRNVLLVSTEQNTTNSILWVGEYPRNYDRWYVWMCSRAEGDGPSTSCSPESFLADAAKWKVFDHPVAYCLSETTEEKCSVRFSFDIMIVVLVCNALKLVCMLYILYSFKAEKILASVGDAMSSFITLEDPTTRGICLANKRHLAAFWRQPGFGRQYNSQPGRWHRAVSIKRWLFFTVLMLCSLALVLALQGWGISVLKFRNINPYSLGFGVLDANALVISGNGYNTAGMVLLANVPQLVLSVIYLVYNGLMTSMFLSADFAAFATKPQYLMMTSPCGKQRGTWLLGLPLVVGLCSLSLQTLLHWFVSQSIFAVQILIKEADGFEHAYVSGEFEELANCGYSPLAIWASFAGGSVLALSAFCCALRKYRVGAPPVVSTCSAAISAACHPYYLKDEATVYQQLRWGAMPQPLNPLGHCSIVPAKAFENNNAGPPNAGACYAGLG